MAKKQGSKDVTEQEFKAVRKFIQVREKLLWTKESIYKAAELEFGRSRLTIHKVASASSWKNYSHRTTKTKGMFDSNLTKKQAKAFLDMQTDNRLLKGENIYLKDKAERLEGDLEGYRKRDVVDAMKAARKASAKRGIWRFIPFIRRTE